MTALGKIEDPEAAAEALLAEAVSATNEMQRVWALDAVKLLNRPQSIKQLSQAAIDQIMENKYSGRIVETLLKQAGE